MHPYVWIPLIACAVSAMTAGVILARDPASPANRGLCMLGLCNAFWAMCEVVWNTSEDPAHVLALVKLSALGWIWLGPICLHLFASVSDERFRRAERLLPLGYGFAAVLLLLTWTTDWMHTGLVRTSWGWAYTFGPLFPFFYGLTLAGFILGFHAAVQTYRRYASPAERSQGLVALVAVGVPLVVGSLTDGLLPMMGWQTPRLGTLVLALLGATIAWSYFRFGYSVLAPGRFAPEILESLADGVMLVRLNGDVRIVNQGMARMLSRPAEDVHGLQLQELLPFVPVTPLQEVDDLEGDLQVAPDHPIPVSVSSSLLRDKRGLPIGIVLMVHDLREVVALRHRLVTSGRLAAVGQLAAGIAHEINNPIAFIRSNLGVLRGSWQQVEKELAGDDTSPELRALLHEGHEVIGECLEGVDRAAGIVRDVKGFSHAGEGDRHPTQIGPLLDRVLRIAEPQLRGSVRIERDYDGLPPVPCAPQELQQVFLNLVLNAAQAVEPGGRIRVSAREEPDGRHLVVAVQDDGCGIDPEVEPRIFDPFFTTKAVGEGTGLGLAISYQIVRNHGGELRVASSPGRGSCFEVALPLGEI